MPASVAILALVALMLAAVVLADHLRARRRRETVDLSNVVPLSRVERDVFGGNGDAA